MEIKRTLKSVGLGIGQALAMALLCVSCGGGGGGSVGGGTAPPPTVVAPAITTQPVNQSVSVGSPASFSVVASGEAPLTYQWKRDGVDIAGATAASYSLTTTQVLDTQSKWSVVVRNAGGSVASGSAILKVSGIGLIAGSIDGRGNIDGTGAGAKFFAPEGVAADTAGNVYVADSENHTIRKISPGGAATTLAGKPGISGFIDGVGAAARFSHPSGVAVDGTGNVYVVENYNQTIRKISPAGVVTTLAGDGLHTGLVNGAGAAARFNYPSGIAIDAVGNLYVADTNNHAIRKITSAGVVTTFAGIGAIAGSANGTVATATFNLPSGVAVDGSGNVYVADAGSNTIRKITSAGVVTTLAGGSVTGGWNTGSPDGTGTDASFHNPTGLAVDGSDNVYVTDRDYHDIRKITPAGVVTLLAGSETHFVVTNGTLTSGGAGSADGTGTAARFSVPNGIAVDGSGNLFVADTGNSAIRKIVLAAGSGIVTTFAGSATLTGSSDGTGAAAGFNYAQGVGVDAAGNTYVADTFNHTIRKISPFGVVTTLAGGAGFIGVVDGTGAGARFNYPSGLAVDGAGNIYVTDYGSGTIRKITSTGVVTTLAGMPLLAGSADGIGAAARFYGPRGIAVDGSGNLYVADTANHIIRKISSTGVVTTLAGTALSSGTADGTGAAARFYFPDGIAVDTAGNVYVTDRGNNAVRKITAAGVVTTLAGAVNIGSADGVGAAAGFSFPIGIAVDAAGYVYVADSGNGTIRKTSQAGAVTTVAGYAGGVGVSLGGLPGSLYYPTALAIDANGVFYVTCFNSVVKIQL